MTGPGPIGTPPNPPPLDPPPLNGPPGVTVVPILGVAPPARVDPLPKPPAPPPKPPAPPGLKREFEFEDVPFW